MITSPTFQRISVSGILLLALFLTGKGQAQSNVDSFDPGANGEIAALAVQADGKILLAGGFTLLGGGGSGTTTRNHIGRVNSDDTLDTSFDPGANNFVDALAVQTDGKIVVGGAFTTLGGGGTGTTTRNRIGRLNPDGTLDTNFDPGANDFLEALVLQADGKILVGGNFTALGGGTGTTTRNFIGRLNPDGTVDTGFDPGATFAVVTLAVQGDGKILVGGQFGTLGGGGRSRIGRLNPDGTLDISFDPGANSTVEALAVQADGKILVGGFFNTLGGGGTGTTTRNRIGRLNPDGTLDTNFDPGANGDVVALAVQADGKILVGGNFTTLGGGGTGTTTRNFIGRLNPDGTVDTSFDPGANSEVEALMEQADGKILVGGNFNTLGGGGTGTAPRNFIGRLATAAPPVITSPLSATGTLSLPFSYQFEATGATSLAVDDKTLPEGLTFDPALRAIVGNPAVAGTFQVGLSASNSSGTTNATLVLTGQPFPAAGPVIISVTSATGRTGSPFNFQVITSGGSAATRLRATGLPAGLSADAVTGEISGTATTDGSFLVNLSVTDAGITNTATLQLTFTSDLAVPVIVSPDSALLFPGLAFSYTILAPTSDSSDPVTYSEVGPLPLGLDLDPVTGIISGTPQIGAGLQPTPALAGGVVSNVQIFACNSSGCAAQGLFFLLPTGAANISTRLSVGTDDNVLIGGFITQGNAPMKLVVRGIGPSLPLTGVLLDPYLELHNSGGVTIASNDNWKDDLAGGSQEVAIENTNLAPSNDLESAILGVLDPGGYTAVVRGAYNGTGVGLVEVYNLGAASMDLSSEAHLANISTRGDVQTGDNVMIGGFINQGAVPIQVLVRGIGPSLTPFGVSGALANPTLELHKPDGTVVINDDWTTDQETAITATGLAPLNPLESAILLTLPVGEGAYTAIVRGVNGTTGVALVEAYFGNPCLGTSCP